MFYNSCNLYLKISLGLFRVFITNQNNIYYGQTFSLKAVETDQKDWKLTTVNFGLSLFPSQEKGPNSQKKTDTDVYGSKK